MLTVKRAREIAQDVILYHGPANAVEFTTELVMRDADGAAEFTDAEWALIYKQTRKQADRVWVLFGYEPKGGH